MMYYHEDGIDGTAVQAKGAAVLPVYMSSLSVGLFVFPNVCFTLRKHATGSCSFVL